MVKRIFDPFYENVDFADWVKQNEEENPELAQIMSEYFEWYKSGKLTKKDNSCNHFLFYFE